MSKPKQKFIDRCIKDREGKIVLGQTPNIPLIFFLFLTIITALLPDGQLKSSMSQVATCFAFIWAYLELIEGINYFRKVLGGTVIIFIVVNIFSL